MKACFPNPRATCGRTARATCDHAPRTTFAAIFAFAVAFALTAGAGGAFATENMAEADFDGFGSAGESTDATDATDAGDAAADAPDRGDLYGDEKIEVDLLAEDLERAKSASLAASTKVAIQKAHADIIAARIPEQQERSDQAARNLYKMQKDRYNIAEMLLSSQSIDEFILQLDYLHDITRANTREITRANELKRESEEQLTKLQQSRELALSQVATVSEQLEAARATRIAKAEAGIAESIWQAESVASGATVLQPLVDEDDDADDTGGKNNETGKKTRKKEVVQPSTDTSAIPDGADWSQTKEQFVAEWAPRIDAYLEGSPLYGQGENFAKSAWKYCIDPRWSAAISCTESSKGAHCIRPHNAWGWGAADSDPYNLAAEWGSWAEAIDAHARGLANGYGYTITMSGAQAYCPYTWQSWYNRTLGQMALI